MKWFKIVMKAAKGDCSDHIAVTEQNDELDSLAVAINRMIDYFRNTFEGIESDQKNANLRKEPCKQLLEGISDIIMVLSPKGRIKECNEAAVKLSGYSYEELLRLKSVAIIHPDYRKVMKEYGSRLWAGENIVIDSFYRSRMRNIFSMELSAKKILYENEPAILALVRNTTERKKVEKLQSKYLYIRLR